MLHQKCIIKQESNEPITMVIHAESLNKVEQIVEKNFGENSLLYSKPFQI